MTSTPAEDNLIADLRTLLRSVEPETREAFEADRDSLRTLRLQCKEGTIRNAINYAQREFQKDHLGEEPFDIQRLVNLHDGHAGHMEDLIAGSMNTADCAVYKGDMQGHYAVLEILEKHRANFTKETA